MSFIIQGKIIGYKDGIPIVNDNDIKKLPKNYKGKVIYKEISGVKKKQNPYQIFNSEIKNRKTKDKHFKISLEEKKEKWAKLKSKIESGKIKPTKKDIKQFVNSW